MESLEWQRLDADLPTAKVAQTPHLLRQWGRSDITVSGNMSQNDLQHDIVLLCELHRTGSRSSQAERQKVLYSAAGELYALGFKPHSVNRLCPKHIEALVEHWQAKELVPATIKNRLTYLRWALKRVNRQSIMPRRNDALGVPPRVLLTNIDKSRVLDERFTKISCPYLRLSLRMQESFGLRRETSMKIKVHEANQGDWLVLKGSWCKGAVPHRVPILTEAQRQLLREVKIFVGHASLIPPGVRYVTQEKKYENQTWKAGFDSLHGLRHRYAQDRFQALSGLVPPSKGGPSRSQLSPEERARDKKARLIVSSELGHNRLLVVATYLGK